MKTLFERMSEVQRQTVSPALQKYAASLGGSGLRVVLDDRLEGYGVELHVGAQMYEAIHEQVKPALSEHQSLPLRGE